MNKVEQLTSYYFKQRHWHKVLEICQATSYRYGDNSNVDFFTGVALFHLGSIDQAQILFAAILDAAPGRHDAGIYLARCRLSKLENHLAYREIVPHCQDIADPYYLDMAATILSHVGKPQMALPLLEKSQKINPTSNNTLSNEAICNLHLGNLKRAKGLFRELISRDPDNQRAFWQLSKICPAKDTNLIEHMQKSIKKRNLSPKNSIFFNFAIGKQYEDLEDWDHAFFHYDQASTAVRENLNYNVKQDMALIQNVIEQSIEIDLPTRQSHAWEPKQNRGLIFITGLPRSGTSLVDQIISAHSLVQSSGELQAVEFAIREIAKAHPLATIYPTLFGEAIRHSTEFAKTYREATEYLRNDKPWMIDKMPYNYLYLGLLAKSFPSAKIVLVKRNPMDSCFAMFKQLFASKYKFSYSLKDLGHYYLAYSQLMDHWRGLLGSRLVEISYDNLVRNPETSIRSLLEKLGLPFESSCLSPQNQDRNVMTASAHQVRQDIYTSSVGKHHKFYNQLTPLSGFFKQNDIET